MNQRQRTYLYLAGIFCAGLLAGSILGATLTKRHLLQPPLPKQLASQIEKELTQKLDLNPAQQERIRILVAGSIARIMVIYSETIQKIDAEMQSAQKSLTADLTPEQQLKLKDLAKDRQEFLRKHAPVAPTGL